MTKKLAILGTGDSPSPNEATPEPIASAARDYLPVLVNVDGAVFPGSPEASEVCAEAYLAAALKAESEGYAGLYINTVGDYGLARVREACGIPATGAGEGAITTARERGQRFAIVTIWPPALRFIYDGILEATGAGDECAAIHHLSDDVDLGSLADKENFVTEMQACGITSMSKIREACRRGLEEDGADVIILGCTCMQPTAALLEAHGVPVIEPMTAGYLYLESLAEQHSKS
jgi:allantoin racemase